MRPNRMQPKAPEIKSFLSVATCGSPCPSHNPLAFCTASTTSAHDNTNVVCAFNLPPLPPSRLSCRCVVETFHERPKTQQINTGICRPHVDTLEQHGPPFLPGEERRRPQHFLGSSSSRRRRRGTRQPWWRCQCWRNLPWHDEAAATRAYRAGRGEVSTSGSTPISSRGTCPESFACSGVLVFQLFEERGKVPHMKRGREQKYCKHHSSSVKCLRSDHFFSVSFW